MDPHLLEQVAHTLTRAHRVLSVTGAGLSADSGLPTYRGVGGGCGGAETPSALPIEIVLPGPMPEQDPALCWRHVAETEALSALWRQLEAA